MSDGDRHDLVVRAGRLFPRFDRDGTLEHAWVAVDGGRVTAIGTGPAPPAAQTHDHTDDVVLPGFVNTHAHLVGVLARGLGGDRSTRLDASALRPTVAVRTAMTAADAEAAARLALLEMLLSGVTTTTDSQVAFRGLSEQADGTLTALRDSAIRARWYRSSIDRTDFFPPDVHDTAGRAASELARLRAAFESDRLTIGVEAMALHRVSDGLLDALVGLSADTGAPLAIHGPYSHAAADHGLERFGRSVVAELDARGAINERLLLYHPVHVDERDVNVLAAAGCGLAVCAVDNMLTASGTAPVGDLLAAGARVGLGLDQPNDGHDMFQLMKTTILQQRMHQRSTDFGSPELALSLATTGGAAALHLDGVIGTLQPGADADIVVLDGSHPALHPIDSVVSNLVYAVGPQAVSSVYVAGKRVVSDGRHATWDHAEVAARADEARRRCRRRA